MVRLFRCLVWRARSMRALCRIASWGFLVVAGTVAAARDLGSGHSDEKKPTPREIRARLGKEGAQQVLRDLTARLSTWDHVRAGVSSGSREWLEVAAALEPVADGGYGLSLVLAFQDALPRSPKTVLEIVRSGSSFTVFEACGGYGEGQLEDERPSEVLLGLVRERRTAVQAVIDRALSDVQRGCLAELDRLALRIKASAKRRQSP